MQEIWYFIAQEYQWNAVRQFKKICALFVRKPAGTAQDVKDGCAWTEGQQKIIQLLTCMQKKCDFAKLCFHKAHEAAWIRQAVAAADKENVQP